MAHTIDVALTELRNQLLLMSTMTERNFSLAIQALLQRDDSLADTVEGEDSPIDLLEVHIDELVVQHMALRGPVATDCRLMLCASKISANLERIGDEATTIARRARDLNKEPALAVDLDISGMAKIAREMLHESIGLYVEGSADAAIGIVARDKSVDALHREMVKELTGIMIADSSSIARCLHFLRVVKSIERVADHAANIAEEVYYLYRAMDIRHNLPAAAAG